MTLTVVFKDRPTEYRKDIDGTMREVKFVKEMTKEINYVHFENGKIYYTLAKDVHGVYSAPISHSLDMLERFEVTE